jgi:hypothetical protein
MMRWYGGVMIPAAWDRFIYRGFLYVREGRRFKRRGPWS